MDRPEGGLPLIAEALASSLSTAQKPKPAHWNVPAFAIHQMFRNQDA